MVIQWHVCCMIGASCLLKLTRPQHMVWGNLAWFSSSWKRQSKGCRKNSRYQCVFSSLWPLQHWLWLWSHQSGRSYLFHVLLDEDDRVCTLMWRWISSNQVHGSCISFSSRLEISTNCGAFNNDMDYSRRWLRPKLVVPGPLWLFLLFAFIISISNAGISEEALQVSPWDELFHFIL